jgi:hypothetical protein
MGKGARKANMVRNLCTHVYNAKMIPVKLFHECGGWGEGVNPSIKYLIHSKTFVNAIMYFHLEQQ